MESIVLGKAISKLFEFVPFTLCVFRTSALRGSEVSFFSGALVRRTLACLLGRQLEHDGHEAARGGVPGPPLKGEVTGSPGVHTCWSIA